MGRILSSMEHLLYLTLNSDMYFHRETLKQSFKIDVISIIELRSDIACGTF